MKLGIIEAVRNFVSNFRFEWFCANTENDIVHDLPAEGTAYICFGGDIVFPDGTIGHQDHTYIKDGVYTIRHPDTQDEHSLVYG